MLTTQEKERPQRKGALQAPKKTGQSRNLSTRPREWPSPIHRAVGNYAMQAGAESGAPLIQRTCACGGTCASCARKNTEDQTVQPRLTVGPAHDVYEQEADRVADHVMRMPAVSGQPDHEAGTVRIQRRVSPATSHGQAPSGLPEVSLPSSSGQPLASSTRQYMEPRFGMDFSQVRVHSGPAAQETAAQIQARAFTHGANIWLGKGATERDSRLMAHELTHVVQQGAASPSTAEGVRSKGDEHTSAIQREPQSPCPDGVKRITVDLVSLRGSNRNPVDDLNFANTVFRPCCVQFDFGIGVTVDPTDSDTWLGGDTVLDRFTSCGTISPEEQAMYDGARASYSIGNRFQAYYVETLNPAARAASKPPYCATGVAAPYVDTTRVSNQGQRRTLAHEFGHILLNSGRHTGIDNPADTSNLMIPTNSSTGETLDSTQCATIFHNA